MIEWVIVHCMLLSFAWLIVGLDANRPGHYRRGSLTVAIGAAFLAITSVLLGAIIVSMGALEWLMASLIPLAASSWLLSRRAGVLLGSRKKAQ
jgi:hypothetical protein